MRNRHHNPPVTSHQLYSSWVAMHQRCTNPNATSYDRYGARGIKVCRRWKKFANFIADMGDRPEGMTLDRKDNDGDYKPGNCRWATRLEQRKNRPATMKKRPRYNTDWLLTEQKE